MIFAGDDAYDYFDMSLFSSKPLKMWRWCRCRAAAAGARAAQSRALVYVAVLLSVMPRPHGLSDWYLYCFRAVGGGSSL